MLAFKQEMILQSGGYHHDVLKAGQIIKVLNSVSSAEVSRTVHRICEQTLLRTVKVSGL